MKKEQRNIQSVDKKIAVSSIDIVRGLITGVINEICSCSAGGVLETIV